MEALMELNFSKYSENMLDILKIFQQIGWNIYNYQGKIKYLPIGDNDDYDWQCGEISEIELYDIISEKVAKKEKVGVSLFYHNGTEGIDFIANATDQIILSIDINRKTVYGKYTNMIWYIENIIYRLFDAGVRLVSYRLEEYED